DDSNTSSSSIASATYTVDGGPPTGMTAGDGAFDEVTETVTADVPITPSVIGQYLICVYGSDSEGNDNTTGLCVTLTVADDVDPVADFTVTPEQPTVDTEVTLNAAGSSDAHSAIASYSWTVLDPELNEHTLTGEVVLFTPDQAGEYTIVLNVSDEWGNWATGQYTLVVESPEADVLALQVAGAIGVGVGVVLLGIVLLFYRTPPVETVLAKMKEVEPFVLSDYRDIPVPVASVLVAGDYEKVLSDTRNAVMENARLSEQRDEWADSTGVIDDA
ncbi:MAG: PKD domain-containing protein, partial [Thermoplasmata archaeon]